MLTRILFIALLVFALPAFAQSSGKTGTTTPLSSSDEDFLSEMPLEDFPGADELQDLDEDGIVDSEQADMPILPPGEKPEDKPKVKYVYKGGTTTTLRRSIQDDRIDDGYIQGLMNRGATP